MHQVLHTSPGYSDLLDLQGSLASGVPRQIECVARLESYCSGTFTLFFFFLQQPSKGGSPHISTVVQRTEVERVEGLSQIMQEENAWPLSYHTDALLTITDSSLI